MQRHPLPARLPFLRLLLAAAAAGDTCAAKGLSACSRDLPRAFCCPEGSSCVSLAAGTTVLCCPADRSCDSIRPITCSVDSQDPRRHPEAPIKTTVFDVALQKCGPAGRCCPFGYSCADDGAGCANNKDQSKPPGGERPATSPSSAAAEPSATSTADAAASAMPSDVSSPGPALAPDKGPLIGGIVAGVAGFVLLAVVVVLCVRRRRRAASDQDSIQDPGSGAGSGPYGHVISAPVLHPGSYRSDFLRGRPASPEPPPAIAAAAPYSPAPARLGPTPRLSIPNPFDSPDPSPYSPLESRMSVTSVEELTARTGQVVGSRLAPIRAMKPTEARFSRRMSRHDVGRDPAFEDIDVFADPDSVRPGAAHHRVTTMSDMMDEVGLGDVHRGRRPYVPGATPRI